MDNGLFDFGFDFGVEQYSIEDVRQDLMNVVRYFQQVDYWEHAMQLSLVQERKLPIQVAYDADLFWIDEETTVAELPEWMLQESLGIVKAGKYIPEAGRLIYPVKDVRGQVMGFCGWDPFVKPKYLDSKNYGYKAKATTFYGMEKLEEYYKNNRPVYVTEGIVDCLWLRLHGFQAFAVLGSFLTPYVIQILRRFGSRLVMIPDNDETGDSFIKQIKRQLPKALIVQAAKGKDVDGMRKMEDGIYELPLIEELRLLSNPFVRTKLLIRR